MAYISSVTKIDLPDKVDQQQVKDYVRNLFSPGFPQIERLMDVFDNTEIKSRNFCKPFDYYEAHSDFEQNNKEFVKCALEYSVQAIEECLKKDGITKESITDIVFVSST